VIFAASLHFLMSVGGLASFGHAAYFGLGAYGVAFLAKAAGLPMIVSLLLGPLLGLLGAAVFGFFAVLIAAGIMVAAPITHIQLLTVPAYVLYLIFLVVGGRHIWRWFVAIRNSENRSR
jgi:branched-chain amino acid transport system permease protein